MFGGLERVQILLQQQRFKDAEAEARQALAGDVDRAAALSLLAIAISGQDRNPEAQQAVEQAIAEDPDRAFSYYIYAQLLRFQGKLKPAQDAIETALRSSAEDPEYLCELAMILLQRGRPSEASGVVNRGLQADPDSASLRHVRTQVRIALRDVEGAGESARDSIAQDPEDATGHTQLGYVALRQNDLKTAQMHFSEALRLNPESEPAKAGLLTVLKGRRWLFRRFLSYSNWMQSKGPGVRWIIILGAMFLARGIGGVVALLYFLFVYFTWTIDSLTNLLLRLDPVGRVLLSKDEQRASSVVGALLGLALLSVLLGFWIRPLWLAATVFGLLVLPVSGAFASEGTMRRVMTVVSVILAMVGLTGVALSFTGVDEASAPMGLFLLGTVLSTWIGGAAANR